MSSDQVIRDLGVLKYKNEEKSHAEPKQDNDRLFNPSVDNINQNLITGWASDEITGDRGVKVVFKEAVKIKNVIMGTLCYSDDGVNPSTNHSNCSLPIPVKQQEDPAHPDHYDGHDDRGWKFGPGATPGPSDFASFYQTYKNIK